MRLLAFFRRILTTAIMAGLIMAAACISPTLQCAEAALATYTGSLGPVSPNQNTYINVSQFDPTLGTLTGATFTLTGSFAGTYHFLNNDGPNRYGYWGQMGDISISYGSMSVSAAVSDPNKPIGDWVTADLHKVGPQGGLVNGTTYTGPTISMNPSRAWTFTSPGDLNAFIGTGTLPFHFVANQTSMTILQGGNGTWGIDTFTSGTVTAQYEYTAAPIPAAVWLLGSGLVGLIGLRRRSREI
jgi:hypothetical protein